MDLLHKVVEIKGTDRQDLLDALIELSDYDLDFNGENGLDYVNEEIYNQGYKSHQSYYIDKVKDIENDIDCIETFLDYWLKHDNYYGEYSFDVVYDKDFDMIAISFASIIEY